MSRSRKKSIVKVKGHLKGMYWRLVRKRPKSIVREIGKMIGDEEYVEGLETSIPNPKTIINDYDYVDYISDCEHTHTNYEEKEKLTRK